MVRKPLFTSISVFALIAASIIFGMVLAGLLDVGSTGNALMAPQQTVTTPATPGGGSDFVEVARVISPAVVAITATHVEKSRRHSMMDPDLFRYWFFGPPDSPREREEEEQPVRNGGSGFIISPDGYIITNNHVIAEAEDVEVTFNVEGSDPVKAEIIGADPSTDIALLKIDADQELPYLKLGDSDGLQVGEWVVAAGYPLRYGYTVTTGVVSAKGKQLGISDVSFEDFIQTDAAINFGNSGGPLVNTRGEVVGINTAIAARGQNIGFAVPIMQYKRIEKQLKEKGKVVRGYLGVNIRPVDRDIQDAFDLSNRDGAFVDAVQPDTPAEKAGIRHGDVIVKVDDVTIEKPDDLINYVASREPESKVTIIVLRDGKKKTLTATLGERNEAGGGTEQEEPSKDDKSVQKKLGVTITELTPELRRYYRIDEEVEGLLITKVKTISPAAKAGLRQGDIITEIARIQGPDLKDMEKIAGELKAGDVLPLYILRPGRQALSFFVMIRIDE